MSVLIDISHPAHVHFFRPLAEALIADDVAVHIVARDKDVTVRLLEASGLPFEVLPMGRPGAGRLSAAAELLRRSWALRRRIRQHKVEVVLTRNPSGAIAAFGTRATSIFDTVDGRHVGIHYWAARPFADIVTSSIHDPENHGRNHCRYPGLREQMSLHPNRFTPDYRVRRQYFGDDETYSVVRFSAHDAIHDRSIKGLSQNARQTVLKKLERLGPVLMSIERGDLQILRVDSKPADVEPRDFHQLLSQAALFVGDSQSVAAEAAVLGVPSLRLSSFSGRLFYLEHLESEELVQNFVPGEEDHLIREIDTIIEKPTQYRAKSLARAESLRDRSGDIAAWYIQLIRIHLVNGR